jgi:hypothetical protein
VKYCHPKDAKIVEDERENTKGEKLLYSCDGDLLFAFPNDWTDEQVMKALDFANEAFGVGRRLGRLDKAYEIRKALGMTA